jgi:hypothetical protein
MEWIKHKHWRWSGLSPTASIPKAAKCFRPIAPISARRSSGRCTSFDRRRAQMPPKTGEPWTEEEDRKLLAAFDTGRALQELAAAHERTMGAVRARLLKYGRINA